MKPASNYQFNSKISINSQTQTKDILTTMSELQSRVSDNAKQAKEMETEIYSNIGSYEFELMGIKLELCIDVIDLYFEPKQETTRSFIKQYITQTTGKKYYIKDDDSDVYKTSTGFTIKLHNIRNKHDLSQVITILTSHYGVPLSSMKVKGIELALDFYNAPHVGLVTALFKSLRIPQGTIQYNEQGKLDIRTFKYSKGSIPPSPHKLLMLLEQGWNIGINHRDNDAIYYHLYFKRTDNGGRPLPKNKWRIRIEVNLKEIILSEIGNDLLNFDSLLKVGFKYLRFTKLKSKVSPQDKHTYISSVKPFGMELESYYTLSRNKTNLNNIVEKNAHLNTRISKLSNNFARFNFTNGS